MLGGGEVSIKTSADVILSAVEVATHLIMKFKINLSSSGWNSECRYLLCPFLLSPSLLPGI